MSLATPPPPSSEVSGSPIGFPLWDVYNCHSGVGPLDNFCQKLFLSVWWTHVLFGATGTPVLDFWWRLLWVSKPGWVLPHSLLCGGKYSVHSWDPSLVLQMLTSLQPASQLVTSPTCSVKNLSQLFECFYCLKCKHKPIEVPFGNPDLRYTMHRSEYMQNMLLHIIYSWWNCGNDRIQY